MAHSVAQVQLAPTGLKSISSFHYLKREKERKERGQREERRNAKTEEVKQVLYVSTASNPHLFIQSTEKMNLERGGGGGFLIKRETLDVACLKLDKGPPVNLLGI